MRSFYETAQISGNALIRIEAKYPVELKIEIASEPEE